MLLAAWVDQVRKENLLAKTLLLKARAKRTQRLLLTAPWVTRCCSKLPCYLGPAATGLPAFSEPVVDLRVLATSANPKKEAAMIYDSRQKELTPDVLAFFRGLIALFSILSAWKFSTNCWISPSVIRLLAKKGRTPLGNIEENSQPGCEEHPLRSSGTGTRRCRSAFHGS